MRRALLALTVLLVGVVVWALERPSPVRAVGPPEAGTVRFVRDAGKEFEPFVRTRRYAAYQRKWMRRIPGLVSLPADRPPSEVADAILEVARAR